MNSTSWLETIPASTTRSYILSYISNKLQLAEYKSTGALEPKIILCTPFHIIIITTGINHYQN